MPSWRNDPISHQTRRPDRPPDLRHRPRGGLAGACHRAAAVRACCGALCLRLRLDLADRDGNLRQCRAVSAGLGLDAAHRRPRSGRRVLRARLSPHQGRDRPHRHAACCSCLSLRCWSGCRCRTLRAPGPSSSVRRNRAACRWCSCSRPSSRCSPRSWRCRACRRRSGRLLFSATEAHDEVRSAQQCLPPPLRGRDGEGGRKARRRLLLTPLPTAFADASAVDLPRKGGGEPVAPPCPSLKPSPCCWSPPSSPR